MQESVGLYCVESEVPPFTRDKKQLSTLEVETASQLSRVRIHVERVFGFLKQKYMIFKSVLPISSIMGDEGTSSGFIEKAAVIFSALCNCELLRICCSF